MLLDLANLSWVLLSNGYMYDFNAYTGPTAGREIALGEKAVLTLSDSIMGHHHQLFFDNSMNLLSTLLEKGTYACGTIRTNSIVRISHRPHF